MRNCKFCKELKPITDFVYNRTSKTGIKFFKHICKECHHKKYAKYYVDYIKTYKETPKYKRMAKISHETYKYRHPEKFKAHTILNNAIHRGVIKKEPCKNCGDTIRVHAHHVDYSKPLEVFWLCPQHHKDAHYGRINL